MRPLLVCAAAAAAVVIVAVPPASSGDPSVDRVQRPASQPGPSPAPLPRPDPAPDDDWCTVPAGLSLESCPPGDRVRPPVSCVLPVGLPPGGLVTPDCPPPPPAPEGRVVPVLPTQSVSEE